MADDFLQTAEDPPESGRNKAIGCMPHLETEARRPAFKIVFCVIITGRTQES